MSTKETMSVHKALCELKTIGDRIVKTMNSAAFVFSNEHANSKVNGVPVEDCKAHIRDVYNSVVDLTRRREAIKCAVVNSNAKTIVVVGGKEYTVAEAIEMKNHGMDFYKAMRDKLASELARAKRNAEMANGLELERRADGYIKNLYGSTDMKSLAAEAVEERTKFITQHTTEIVDPLNATKQIEELDKMIYDFMTSIDAALSVSNAITEIEISY